MTTAPLHTVLADLIAQLAAAPVPPDDPARAARLIIAHTCGLDPAIQIAQAQTPLTADQVAAAHRAAIRHGQGEPLSRIRGTREFYGLAFALSPATLDPRPDTEVIVDEVLKFIRQAKQSNLPPSGGGNPEVLAQTISLLDLGTGTGCIPIALLKHAPNLTATAVDYDPTALATASQNAATHGVADRITFIESDWFDALPPDQSFDIITSNPPYIPAPDIDSLDPAVRLFDPILALSGGNDGLDAYRKIFSGLSTRLAPHGVAFLEFGLGQADDLTRLAIKYGLDVAPPLNDSTGRPRVLRVQKSG